MAAFLTLEAIGPNGEKLAIRAGELTGVAVGWDPEFECANFDSDEHDDEQLQATVFAALDGIDPDWRSQLRPSD